MCEYRLNYERHNSLFTELVNLHPKEVTYNTRTTKMWNVLYCRTGYGRQMLHNKLLRLLNDYNKQKTIDIHAVKLSDLYAF